MRCICSNYACTQMIFKKSNVHCTRVIKFAVVPKRSSERRSPTSRFSVWATQLRRNVAAVANRRLHCVRSDRPGNRISKLSHR